MERVLESLDLVLNFYTCKRMYEVLSYKLQINMWLNLQMLHFMKNYHCYYCLDWRDTENVYLGEIEYINIVYLLHPTVKNDIL